MKVTDTRVWSMFTRNVNGVQVKFKIQELPEDKFEDVMELFMKFHTPEEPLRTASGVADNPAALKEFQDVMLQVMYDEKQNVLVCCIDDDSDELKMVGANKMTLVARDAPKITRDYNVKTTELQNLFRLRNSLYSTYNVLQEHDTEKAYFADRGLVVDPTYRCLGIAEELMLARGYMLKEQDITLYTGMATAIGSQKIAEKLGAKVVRELDLGEYAKKVGISFSGQPVTIKLMVGRVPL